MIRFAKKKKKKKTVLGILSKKVAKDDTENFDLRKRKDGVVPTIMGKIVEGRSSVLNNLSLRWWLHTYINMESRQLDIKFYNSEDKSKMEMTIGNLSLCGCLNPWENIVTKEERFQ